MGIAFPCKPIYCATLQNAFLLNYFDWFSFLYLCLSMLKTDYVLNGSFTLICLKFCLLFFSHLIQFAHVSDVIFCMWSACLVLTGYVYIFDEVL